MNSVSVGALAFFKHLRQPRGLIAVPAIMKDGRAESAAVAGHLARCQIARSHTSQCNLELGCE